MRETRAERLERERLERLSHFSELVADREREAAERQAAERAAAQKRAEVEAALERERAEAEAALERERAARRAAAGEAHHARAARWGVDAGVTPWMDEPTDEQAFILAAYVGLRSVPGQNGRRWFEYQGELRNTMGFADVVRELFSPQDPLENGLPVRTYYRVHRVLVAAGCRAIPEHIRPGENHQETHARPLIEVVPA